MLYSSNKIINKTHNSVYKFYLLAYNGINNKAYCFTIHIKKIILVLPYQISHQSPLQNLQDQLAYCAQLHKYKYLFLKIAY